MYAWLVWISTYPTPYDIIFWTQVQVYVRMVDKLINAIALVDGRSPGTSRGDTPARGPRKRNVLTHRTMYDVLVQALHVCFVRVVRAQRLQVA